MKKISTGYFNLFKFFAAIAIAIFLHYDAMFLRFIEVENPYMGNTILRILYTRPGVFCEMYFMMSGILFVFAYMEKIIAKSEGRLKFDNFIYKRWARMFPIAIITTLFMWVLNIYTHDICHFYWYNQADVKLEELIVDLVFGSGKFFNTRATLNGPTWFISIIMLDYIVAYLLTLLYAKCRSKLIFSIPIICGFLIFASEISLPAWNENIARGYISFFIGIYLGFIMQYIHENEIKIRWYARLLLVIEALTVFRYWDKEVVNDNPCYVFSFLIFPSIIVACFELGWLERLCETKVVRFLGNIYFGIYLWNFPILTIVTAVFYMGKIKGDVTAPGFILLVMVIHILVATLSYYVVEKPVTKWLSAKEIDLNK